MESPEESHKEPSPTTDPPGSQNPLGKESRNGKDRIKSYSWALLAVWTLTIGISLGWSLYQAREGILIMALEAARINYEKDVLYRRWAAIHGGVYVPVTPATPPNPYLENVPERDLTTPSGRHLTLMNPSYITRQVFSLSLQESAIRGHITSLKPLRPENLPDLWETQALQSFAQGKSEAYTTQNLEGRPYFRLMRPVFAEKSCLKCHAHQGYQEGDIRGGISISIPLDPLYAEQKRTIFTTFLGHAFLWLVGLAGISLGQRNLMNAWQQQENAENALKQSNSQLHRLVAETGRLHRETSLVSEMTDHLHACLTLEEAGQIIHRLAPQLFPAYSGSLFLLNASRNILELIVNWGEVAPNQSVFEPQRCWALRRGRPYQMLDPAQDLICEHLAAPSTARYYCLPLVAQGDTLGVLQVRSAASADGDDTHGVFPETVQSLARTVAEHLALSLGNIKLQETLRHQAIRDPLTGLFNRRFMVETLELELHRMRRRELPLAVVMLDIDHFKRYNDTFGHSSGDVLLSALGQMVRQKVRKEDVACRYGGEEFTVIMPETSLETACQRAEELRQAVHDLHPEHQGRGLGGITISLGVAVFPQDGENHEDLLRAADAALYEAKHAGRDRVVASRKADQDSPDSTA